MSIIVRFAGGLVGFEVEDDSALGRQARRDALVREAEAQLAPYPQYAGYFAPEKGWRLAVCRKTLSTKGGLSFTEGRDYLARIEDDPDAEFYGKTFGFSRERGIACLVHDDTLAFASGEGEVA